LFKRIFIQLLDALAECPEQGAMYLAEYGDPAALPELSRALDAYQISVTEDGDHALFELREAIEALGGALTDAQQTKYEHALLACRIKGVGRNGSLAQPCGESGSPLSRRERSTIQALLSSIGSHHTIESSLSEANCTKRVYCSGTSVRLTAGPSVRLRRKKTCTCSGYRCRFRGSARAISDEGAFCF